MATDKRVKMKCSQCDRINYRIHKSNGPFEQGDKLELKKHCKWCETHTVHKEA